jgi:hypothetical protein
MGDIRNSIRDRQEANISTHRTAYLFVALLTAADLGISARFWRAVFKPPQEYVVGWSPAIYWLLGIILAAAGITAARNARNKVPRNHRVCLLILNGLCFSGYLLIPTNLLWRSWQSLH